MYKIMDKNGEVIIYHDEVKALIRIINKYCKEFNVVEASTAELEVLKQQIKDK